jgi:hypothetical protein
MKVYGLAYFTLVYLIPFTYFHCVAIVSFIVNYVCY